MDASIGLSWSNGWCSHNIPDEIDKYHRYAHLKKLRVHYFDLQLLQHLKLKNGWTDLHDIALLDSSPPRITNRKYRENVKNIYHIL